MTAPRTWAVLSLILFLVLGLVDAFQFFTYQAWIHEPVPWSVSLRQSVPGWLLWWLLTPLVLVPAWRLPIAPGTWIQNGLTHLLLAIVFSLGHLYVLAQFGVPWGTQHFDALPPDEIWWRSVSGRLVLGFLTYLVILGAFHSLRYHQTSRKREEEARRLLVEQAKLKAHIVQAELSALKMQLQPHFLFNTLHAISTKVLQRETEAADRMITRLSDFLRLTLDSTGEAEVPLAAELEFLESYLSIQRIRFPERLRVEIVAAPEVRNALVPNFVLQPLVENAIRHGIEADPASGTISISATREGEDLVLEVTDDGVGLSAASEVGVGISNIRARLDQLYGNRAAISLSGESGLGTTATIRLPLHLAPSASADDETGLATAEAAS